MKNLIRTILQKVFGFRTYLFIFSVYCVERVRRASYEKEFSYFLDLIPNRGIVLDIGANIGITMAPMAKKLTRAEIHAYEPIKENFSNLERLVRWFNLKNVRLFYSALGNTSGTIEMIMPLDGSAKMQGLCKVHQPELHEKGIIYQVPIKELDKIYPDATNISAIKIDVENFEYEVLTSGKRLLEANKPIIYCELWKNEKRLMVVDYLLSLGYSVLTYNETTSSLVPVPAAGDCEDNNFFFLPA